MSSITLNEREAAVFRLVMMDVAPPTLSKAEWTAVAAKVGITNGQVDRNARFAFNAVLAKLGCKGGKACGGGGKRKKVKDEEAEAGDEGAVKEEDGGEEEEEKPVAKKAKGKGKKA